VKNGSTIFVGVLLLLVLCCVLVAFGQDQPPKPAAPQVLAPQPVPLTAAPDQQAKVDAAWKDIEIAQLRLQLVVTQVLAEMPKDSYYDFNQQKFLRRPPTAQKPVLPAPPPK